MTGKRRRWSVRLAVAALMLFGAAAAHAGDRLSVRLVEASNEGEGVPPRLRDVESLLRDNLPYRAFYLRDEKVLRLPASGTVNLAQGYRLTCSGPKDQLSVTLERDGRVWIQTVLSLRDGRPFILGGLPSEHGKTMLILLVR